MQDQISIIGAGIGGLTCAIMLQQKGFNVSVYEGAPEIKPIGAGIIIAQNAMQVYEKFGLKSKIQEAGNRISSMKITDAQFNPLSIMDLTPFEQKYDVSNVAIHRGVLQKILAEEVGFGNIHLSKRLAKAEKSEGYTLTFEDGSEIKTPVLIGADGLKSVVRTQIFGKHPIRDAQQICWRGVCEFTLPESTQYEGNEAWGKGKRFGFVPIDAKKVYWYALIKGSTTDLKADEPANLKDIFSDFHSLILDLIKATSPEQIIVSQIADLQPITQWQKDKVCLIGDAAHATTPNLGQGACQAVEDVYILGQCLGQGSDIENAFRQYQQRRVKKAHKIVNTSWQLGKLAHVENALGVQIRNGLMKMLPQSANRKQLETIFSLDY